MRYSRKEFLQVAGVLTASNLPSVLEVFPPKAGQIEFHAEIRRLDLRHTWTISRNSSEFKENVFVRIEREGLVGFGEAAPNVRYDENAQKSLARIRGARPVFESHDWMHYVAVKTDLDRTIADQSCAKAALDIALLDWVGKRLRAPLYRLFGLDPSRTPVTTYSIGIDAPEVIKQKVREAADFPVLKVKVGREDDAEILAAVRSVTDKPLRVDANEGWRTKEQALEKIRWLESLGVELIEQPLPASMLEETRWLRDRVNMPIIADEAVKTAADIPALASAFDGINVKLMKAGGIQEALGMIKMARALGLKIMLGCMIESSVAIAAAAHISPLVDFADLDGNLLISNDPFTGIETVKGKLLLSDAPGLGVRPI